MKVIAEEGMMVVYEDNYRARASERVVKESVTQSRTFGASNDP